MSFPKFQQDWGSESRTVKQRKTLEKQQKRALRSRQERIANEVLMYFRSQRKLQGEVSLADTLESAGENGSLSLMDVIAVDDNMLEELDTRDACQKVRQCVDTCLTPRERKIIVLRYGLGERPPMTQREIAAQCGISRSYVSRRRYCKRCSPKEKRPETAQRPANTEVTPASPVPGTGSAE